MRNGHGDGMWTLITAKVAWQELAPACGHRSRPKEVAPHNTGTCGAPQLSASCFTWVIPFNPQSKPKKEA